MQILFWALVLIVVYVYAGYPLLLASGILASRQPVRKHQLFPMVSVLIPAHNEEHVIESKIHNLLSLEYPADRLEIVVGSDGSTDATEEIVGRFADQRVRLVGSPVQRGKSAIQNELVAQSKGEIILFTDADSLISHDGLLRLVENFADATVGLVTINPAYSNANQTDIARSESLYWRYENWIRCQESDRALLTTASGWVFAMRRSLWSPLEVNVGDDFVLPIQVCLQGARNLVEHTVTVRTRLAQAQTASMFRMKVRIVSKDLRGLLKNFGVLNPARTGAVAIALLSHKLLRWLVPYFLLLMLISNLTLLPRPFYRATAIGQVVFYLIALGGAIAPQRQLRAPWSIIHSFCLVNLAALVGVFRCAIGRKAGIWKPVR